VRLSAPAIAVVATPNMAELTATQKDALDAVGKGHSIVLAGAAGTGKSFLIRKIAKDFPWVEVTATTGIAAVGVGGITLSRFAGLKTADPGREGAAKLKELRAAAPGDVPRLEEEFLALASAELIKVVRMFKTNVSRLRSARAIVIEECSMMSRYQFEGFDLVCQRIRRRPGVPFGGLQLICVGDMRQLPPVSPDSDDDIMSQFFFTSQLFDKTFKMVFHLTEVFRQSDPVFRDMLCRVGSGSLTPADIALLQSRVKDEQCPDAVRLYGTNRSVQLYNNRKLDSIDSEPHSYKMKSVVVNEDGGSRGQIDSLCRWAADQCIAEKELVLKKGSFVMFLCNRTEELCNGTLGYVVGFNGDTPLFVPQDEYDPDVDYEEADRSKRMRADNGHVYTSTGALEVVPHMWEVTEHTVATIGLMQIPLKLAWAITVHKSQGAQFDKVVASIDQRNCFGPGAAYVALSRCTNLEGLELTSFDPACVVAAPEANAFYDNYCP